MDIRTVSQTVLSFAFCCLAAIWAFDPGVQQDAFHAGKVIPEFGKVADVDSDMKLDADTKLKVCFDVANRSRGKSINQTFDSAARFINLNVASGANGENIKVAIVLHGSAAIDATKSEFYASDGKAKSNPNVSVIEALQKNGTELYICGQTAAYRGIKKGDLLPGVKLAPSAMTAHVLLQQDGFALNPF